MLQDQLKTLFRRLPLAHRAIYRLRGVEYVDQGKDLDAALSRFGVDGKEPGPEAMARLPGVCWRLRSDHKPMPADPFSPEFAAWQRDLYLEVSGRTGYGFENEATEFVFEKQKNDFFPYSTKSPDFVGDQHSAELTTLQYMTNKADLVR